MVYEMILAPVTNDNARNSEASAIKIKGDRVLLAWSDFYGGPTDFSAARISAVISSDSGRKWGEKFTLVENASVVNTMMPSFLRLQSGELALFYLKLEDVADSRIFVRKSYDEGTTWTGEICVTPDKGFHSPANDRCIQLRDGRIVMPDSVDTTFWPNSLNTQLRCYYSDDAGNTWQQGSGDQEVPGGGAEPVIVERKDGSLLMIIRTRLSHIYHCDSFDLGDTWSVPKPMDLAAAYSPPNMKRIPNTGDLLLVWNHSLDIRKRSPLTSAISKDDGETWEHVRNLETNDKHAFAYPSITFLDDEVLLTYYRSRYEITGWELKLKIIPTDWFYQ